MLNKTTVIFDMDGVIFDSEKIVLECWQEVADKYGIYDVETTAKMCLGCNASAAIGIFKSVYGQEFPYEKYKKEMSELFHERCDGGRLPIKEGTRELLQYLKENKIKTAIASSTRTPIVLREINDAGLLDFFDIIVGGDQVTKSKPEPDIFLKAAELLGSTAEECIVIEDSFNGIRAAYKAGMLPVMVPDLKQPDDEIKGLAKYIFSSLHEVKKNFHFLSNR